MHPKIRHKLAKIIYSETTFATHFNVPIKFDQREVRAVNERIIEIPFIFSAIEPGNSSKKILDFGCTRSWISLSLASLGHNVYGIDLRDFPFQHPNFIFKKGNILDFEIRHFDYIISLSTLEHVGLGAYGEEYDHQAFSKVINKINRLLNSDGRFILTLPVGMPSSDQFEKSFSPNEILELILTRRFFLVKENFFRRFDQKYWSPCSKKEIAGVSNDLQSRKKAGSGVNGIGCYIFQKNHPE